jgi:phage baseplate assembly protein gpV
MGGFLSDGTYVPAELGIHHRGDGHGASNMLLDYVLRMGEVKKIIYPEDPINEPRKRIGVEYDVLIDYRDGTGSTVQAPYSCCTIDTLFGGIADRFHATYRADTTKSYQQLGTGSKVLVLCASGDQHKGIIIGGYEDPVHATRKESAESGHNLFFEFNGVRFTIDKEGQAQLLFRGATKIDGELTDEAVKEAEGTNVFIDKQGGVKIATKDDAQFIHIDHENKKILILADSEWNVQVNDKAVIEVQNDVTLNSSAGGIAVGAANNVTIKSAGVLVGGATDAWVKGTTYRAAESALFSQMASALIAMQASLITAIGLIGIPTVGPALAIPGLTSVATQMGSMASSLVTFESNAASYLSTKNLTD